MYIRYTLFYVRIQKDKLKFIQFLDASFAYALVIQRNEVFLAAANALAAKMGGSGEMTQDITKLTAEIFGGITAGEYFITALISPLLYEFAFDGDGVPDNDGVIAGYGVQANCDNIITNISDITSKLMLYIENFLQIFLKIFGIGR